MAPLYCEYQSLDRKMDYLFDFKCYIHETTTIMSNNFNIVMYFAFLYTIYVFSLYLFFHLNYVLCFLLLCFCFLIFVKISLVFSSTLSDFGLTDILLITRFKFELILFGIISTLNRFFFVCVCCDFYYCFFFF